MSTQQPPKKIKAPCKDCTERHSGCHSLCDRYKEFTDRNKAYNEYMMKQQQSETHYKWHTDSRGRWRKTKY